AGTPIGVLLTRALKAYYTDDVKHYSVSIVRDRGIDCAALQHIAESGRPAESIIFVDGWTAKGVINRELKKAIANWNKRSCYHIGDELCVISDLSGHAEYIATTDDYAIPSGVLNSTVSGLLSRTLLLDDIAGFHQCVLYKHLAPHDLSNWFVDTLTERFQRVAIAEDKVTDEWRSERTNQVSAFIASTLSTYGIDDINKIKPGVAEATRVMLRRVPRLLVLKQADSSDVKHLKILAYEKNIPIEEVPDMPFSAMAIIQNVR
ncbi:cysteine protease StiP domain-containing protein, partial [Amphritea sp.]|uniref:cysteine protease StiP domain-containing protein n=1 Tax=Amphritea sp. TaxID=1872502 RepID=UPI003D0C550D